MTADMTGGRDKSTISLVVARAGHAALAPNLMSGADEIVEVGAECGAATPQRQLVRSDSRNGARLLNLGVSQASGDWVVPLFGDEQPAPGWIAQLRNVLDGSDTACIHEFRSAADPSSILFAIQRRAFIYGSFDEAVGGRQTVGDWVERIFPRPVYRALPNEQIAGHDVDWLGSLRTAVKVESARSEPTQSRGASPASVATGAAYDAKTFWTVAPGDYLRWEVYQPDEPEIRGLVSKTAPQAVLELGCGAGRNTRYFAAADSYVGIDISAGLLLRALERQRSNSKGLVCGDASALPFGNDAFDLVFADSTIQHVTPQRIEACICDLVRVSSRYVCMIEYTEGHPGPLGKRWFEQSHMFAHNYAALFGHRCDLVWRADTSLCIHPARKEVFLFEKRN